MQNKIWKEVPIPHKLQNRPKDPRGYPVPYNVFMTNDNQPVFSVNDQYKNWECADSKLCTICGWGLQADTWLIGGPLSAFHPQGAFLDLPVHKECGLYALQVCPYLGIPNYANLKNAQAMGHKHGFIAETLTEANTKVPFFVFCKISNWKIIPTPFLISPTKPYLEVEYWWDGKQITNAEAARLFEQDKGTVTFVEHS